MQKEGNQSLSRRDEHSETSLHSQVCRSSLRQAAKLCLCREQENPSRWKCVPPHRDGQTGESNYKSGCLKTPFLHASGQGSQLKSRYTGKEKGIQDFSYPEKNQDVFPPEWGEGVGSPVPHPGSHKGYSSLTEQAQKEPPAPSQTPTSHL